MVRKADKEFSKQIKSEGLVYPEPDREKSSLVGWAAAKEQEQSLIGNNHRKSRWPDAHSAVQHCQDRLLWCPFSSTRAIQADREEELQQLAAAVAVRGNASSKQTHEAKSKRASPTESYIQWKFALNKTLVMIQLLYSTSNMLLLSWLFTFSDESTLLWFPWGGLGRVLI